MTTAPPEATAQSTPSLIQQAAQALGPGALSEEGLVRHIHPLFSRVLSPPTHPGVYLANHAMGRPPDRTADDVRQALDAWYTKMEGAWNLWLAEIERFRASVARIVGLDRPDAVVPKPAAGQGLRAVVNALQKPVPHIVATRGEFDSIDFILRTYHARERASVRWIEPDGQGLFHADPIIDHIDETVDLVVVSHVYYATGQVLEGLDRVIEACHDCGVHCLVDAYHSAGVLPGIFEELDPDFVIGGCYTYLRGGTGAGWLAISPRHLETPGRGGLLTLDTGWLARGDGLRPGAGTGDPARERAPGGDAWLESTPSVLPIYQAKAGLELALGLGVARLHEYNVRQQRYLMEALRRAGVKVREIEPRGAFVLVEADDATGAVQRLKEAGVTVDARVSPSGKAHLRVGPDILNTREALERAAGVMGRVLGGGR
jgi:kynureninase